MTGRLVSISSRPRVTDNNAAWTNFFHCFTSLTHSAACRIQRFSDTVCPLFPLSFYLSARRQARLAGGGMCSQPVRSSVRSSFTEVWDTLTTNEWIGFDTIWHKWSTGQWLETINFDGQKVSAQVHMHEAKNGFGGLAEASLSTSFGD